jgi:hypothetical protein
MRWQPNTWDGTTLSEINENCFDGSAARLLLDNFEARGLHISENSTFVDVGGAWTGVTIHLAEACPGATDIHGLTISLPSGALDLVVDDILFE